MTVAMHTRRANAGVNRSRALPHLKCRSGYGIDRPFPATFAYRAGTCERLGFVLYAAARPYQGREGRAPWEELLTPER